MKCAQRLHHCLDYKSVQIGRTHIVALKSPSAGSLQESVRLGCYLGAFLWLTTLAALKAVGMKLAVEPEQHVAV